MPDPWKTDQWFSSPWNYLPEVTEGFQIPDDVQIHDVTLRDGEQQAGVEFTADPASRAPHLDMQVDSIEQWSRIRSAPRPER